VPEGKKLMWVHPQISEFGRVKNRKEGRIERGKRVKKVFSNRASEKRMTHIARTRVPARTSFQPFLREKLSAGTRLTGAEKVGGAEEATLESSEKK